MRIANNVAFGTISSLLTSKTKVNIKYRRMGYWKEEIYDGEMSGLQNHKDRYLMDRLSVMKVNALYAEGDVLYIGVENN